MGCFAQALTGFSPFLAFPAAAIATLLYFDMSDVMCDV